jgi:nucleotidyltransferase substrate binding protein (TIGR01987 family)
MTDLFLAFDSSVSRFREILAEEKTTVVRDAAIQRFEFCVELAWKCTQKFLREQNLMCRSPKECLKSAFEFGLIQDDPIWLEMLEDRNLTSHTYQEATANQVFERFPKYLKKLEELKTALVQSKTVCAKTLNAL